MNYALQSAPEGRFASKLLYEKYQILELGPSRGRFQVFDLSKYAAGKEFKEDPAVLRHPNGERVIFPTHIAAMDYLYKLNAGESPDLPLNKEPIAMPSEKVFYPRTGHPQPVIVVHFAEKLQIITFLSDAFEGAPEHPKVATKSLKKAEFDATYLHAKDDSDLPAILRILSEHAKTLGITPKALEYLNSLLPKKEKIVPDTETVKAAFERGAPPMPVGKAPESLASKARTPKGSPPAVKAKAPPVEAPAAVKAKAPAVKVASAPAKAAPAKAPAPVKAKAKAPPVKAAPAPVKAKPSAVKAKAPAAPVKAPAAVVDKVHEDSLSGYLRSLLRERCYSDDEIEAMAAERFGADRMKRNFISWNRNYMRAKFGEVVERIKKKPVAAGVLQAAKGKPAVSKSR